MFLPFVYSFVYSFEEIWLVTFIEVSISEAALGLYLYHQCKLKIISLAC